MWLLVIIRTSVSDILKLSSSRYVTSAFKPVANSYLSGAVASVDSVGWNRNPIQESVPYSDYGSTALWHNAALRSRSVGPGLTTSTGDVMSTVCPSNRRFITLQRLVIKLLSCFRA